MRNRKKAEILLYCIVGLSVINFIFGMILWSTFGGQTAPKGKIENGYYYLGKGSPIKYTEVNRNTYSLIATQSKSILVTHYLGIFAGGIVIYRRINIKKLRSNLNSNPVGATKAVTRKDEG